MRKRRKLLNVEKKSEEVKIKKVVAFPEKKYLEDDVDDILEDIMYEHVALQRE